MQLLEEFTLRQAIVVCPTCNVSFCTPQLTHMPIITASTPVETDLHRILPNGAIRAALVGFCRGCGYAWWITSFKTKALLPDTLTADEYSMERLQYPRKFASAFVTGKKIDASARELALIALNGGWCARETGLGTDRWLELAAEELERALADKSTIGNRGYYHYIMGEIYRQLKDYEKAISHFNRVNYHSRLPRELVLRQKVQATAGDSSATRLPPYLVELLFCPRKPRNKPTNHL
jgi:tetratricopeptide (TPR) repeat protein